MRQYFEVVVRADIIKWMQADTFETAGRRAAEIIQDENWVQPGSVAVVGVEVVASNVSGAFLEHHAVTVEE